MSELRSTKTRPVCPKCGSESVVSIIYGMPTYETFQRAKRGEFALGGCMISADSPEWQCQACHTSFGSRAERDADDASRG
jgi:transposase-like protein